VVGPALLIRLVCVSALAPAAYGLRLEIRAPTFALMNWWRLSSIKLASRMDTRPHGDSILLARARVGKGRGYRHHHEATVAANGGGRSNPLDFPAHYGNMVDGLRPRGGIDHDHQHSAL